MWCSAAFEAPWFDDRLGNGLPRCDCLADNDGRTEWFNPAEVIYIVCDLFTCDCYRPGRLRMSTFRFNRMRYIWVRDFTSSCDCEPADGARRQGLRPGAGRFLKHAKGRGEPSQQSHPCRAERALNDASGDHARCPQPF